MSRADQFQIALERVRDDGKRYESTDMHESLIRVCTLPVDQYLHTVRYTCGTHVNSHQSHVYIAVNQQATRAPDHNSPTGRG